MTKAKKKIPVKPESKKKRLTKKQRILVIALTAIFLISAVCVTIICVKNHKAKQQLEALRANYVQYDACKEDLNSLMDYLNIIFPDAEKRPEYLIIASSDLYEYGGKQLPVPPGIRTSIRAILDKGFVSGKTQWRLISFDGNRIQLDVMDGNYALVYSPDGEPTYLHDETDDFEILVEHIEGHWYHITRMS